MVRWLAEMLGRVPVDDVTRRALGETLADWRHESRSMPRRRRSAMSSLVALGRVLAAGRLTFRGGPMRGISCDVQYAFRRLRASPGFTLFAVVSLALGIGASTAIYSFLRAVTGPPPGVRDIETVVNIYHYPSGGFPMRTLSWPDFQELARRQTTLDHLTAWDHFRQAVTAHGASSTVDGEVVSGSYFALLGVGAMLGRTLQPSDDHPAAPAVAVISHGLWQRMFGGAPDVVGQALKMGGEPFEIVGVAPRLFHGVFNNGLIASAVWIPLARAPLLPQLGADFDLRAHSRRWLMVKGRLREGRSIEEVAAEIAGIAGQLDAALPIGTDISDPRFRTPYSIGREWTVQSAGDVLLNENANAQRYASAIVAAVMAAVLLVLFVACTNLANLVLARNAAREADRAIRQSLGASRWRLVREHLVEHLLLSLAGGAMGLALARVLLTMLGDGLSVDARTTLTVAPRLDIAVLLMALGATLLTLIVAGVLPSLRLFRQDPRAAVARLGSGGALPRWRGRRVLVASQVAVSLVLLAVALVFVREMRAAARIDTGFDVDRLVVAEVDFGEQRIDGTRVSQIVTSVLSAMVHRPDVAAAAVSSGLPIEFTTPGSRVRDPAVPIESGPLPSGDGAGIASAELLAATPDILETLGVAVLRGRPFDDRDAAGAEPVIVVSEKTARTVFGQTDVVGRTVELRRSRWVGEEPQPPHLRTIIGVASDTDTGRPGLRNRGSIYVPLAQQPEDRLTFSVRASGDPAELVGALRTMLLAADPELSLARLGTGRDVLAPPNALTGAAAGVAGVLGGFALVLALAGLYGVLSHLVERRTREIGVRLALGATPGLIQRAVVRDGLIPVVIGLLVGTAASLIARGSLGPMLERLIPIGDPVALVVIPALLLLAGALACYLPARRAAAVDPIAALRDV
jgi:predicted permease